MQIASRRPGRRASALSETVPWSAADRTESGAALKLSNEGIDLGAADYERLRDSPADPRSVPDRRLWPGRAVLLFALSGFAVAQPLFDLLGHNSTFFVAHGIGGTGVLAFAGALLLLPPLVLTLIERLAAFASRTAANWVHITFVGGLAALAAVPPLVRTLDLRTRLAALLFLAIGVATGVAFARIEAIRRLSFWAALAPLLFAAIFLLVSPARALVLPTSSGGAGERVLSDDPAVIVVLDELSLGSLLTPEGEVDATRFPSFARLREISTWYPNATTNATATQAAVPTIVSGVMPRRGEKAWFRPPVTAAYPTNLFTLVGRSRPLDVLEPDTQLCPSSLCPTRTALGGGRRQLIADTGVVYLHTVLPQDLADRWLPALGDRWAGFLTQSDAKNLPERYPEPLRPVVRWTTSQLAPQDVSTKADDVRQFLQFVDRIEPSDRPAVRFIHSAFPHVPYYYLPTLHRYSGDVIPGVTAKDGDSFWTTNGKLVDHGLQRYLLQLKAADRLIGKLISKLQREGMWDRSLVVVTADHGVAFAPGKWRRTQRDGNENNILPVPLFIKYPGQDAARVDRRNAELIDILPTIADVLRIDLRERTDGTSLRRPDPQRPVKRIFWRLGIDTFPAKIDGVLDIAQHIREVFGAGGGRDDLFGLGRFRDLVGTKVRDLDVASERSPASVELDDPHAYRSVDPKGPFLPARLTATLRAERAVSDVAVALNGTIAGVGQPYQDAEGGVRWPAHGEVSTLGSTWRLSIMLSPRLFSAGENRFQLYAVREGSTLVPLHVSTYRAVSDSAGRLAAIEVGGRRTVPVRTEGYRGQIDEVSRSGDVIQIRGWAADIQQLRTPEAFAVVSEGDVVYWSTEAVGRRDVVNVFGKEELERSGVDLDLPAETAPNADELQVYAVFEDAAYPIPRVPRS